MGIQSGGLARKIGSRRSPLPNNRDFDRAANPPGQDLSPRAELANALNLPGEVQNYLAEGREASPAKPERAYVWSEFAGQTTAGHELLSDARATCW